MSVGPHAWTTMTHAQVRYFRFRPGNSLFEEIWSKKKNQNYQFKLKFGIYTNSSMQNLIVVFILFVSDWKYLFWTNSVQKIIIVSLSWNLGPILIRICRIQWRCSLFLFFFHFWQTWSKKSEWSIYSENWYLY